MVGKTNIFAATVAVFLATEFVQISLAATYTVGGSQGWRIPSPSNFYSEWTRNNTFTVGDVLVFNFTSGVHDVATVAKSAYNNCNTSNTLSVQDSPPVSITLNSTGHHYFFCTFPGHCSRGQKLDVEVSSGGAASSPAPGPGASDNTTAPAPSSAPSLSASFAIFASVAAVHKLLLV